MHILNILFDTQIFRQQRYGGISRYFCEVAPRVGRASDITSRILAPAHGNAYLEAMRGDTLIGWKSNDRIRRTRGLGRLEKWASAIAESAVARAYRPDVVHETYYWGSRASQLGAARVLTIYDMIHERFASHFSPDDRTPAAKRRAVERADHVICISESTRRDVIEFLNVPPEKLTVTYLSANLRPGPAAAPMPSTEAPYILYVGERRGYKNFNMLVKAMQSSAQLRGFRLLCFGGGQLDDQEWKAIDELGFPRAGIAQRQGDDRALMAAYQNALCFVYPSLYEGFGIPPLEAMACGCPVACSNTSSIPEVAGDAAAYFDPEDAGSMADAIESIVTSESRRLELKRLGEHRTTVFSWDRCAMETTRVYRSLKRS